MRTSALFFPPQADPYQDAGVISSSVGQTSGGRQTRRALDEGVWDQRALGPG